MLGTGTGGLAPECYVILKALHRSLKVNKNIEIYKLGLLLSLRFVFISTALSIFLLYTSSATYVYTS
jgi:hypothetical protein